MGVVYRARDEKLHRVVALECLSHDEKANISRRRQLMREARCASALNHPNICTKRRCRRSQNSRRTVTIP